jgi:hypothetical protein
MKEKFTEPERSPMAKKKTLILLNLSASILKDPLPGTKTKTMLPIVNEPSAQSNTEEFKALEKNENLSLQAAKKHKNKPRRQ